MKICTVSITNTDSTVRPHLAAIFNYLCIQALTAAGMKTNIIATGRVLQGEVSVYADTTYDTMRAELFINNAIKLTNLFSSENNNFESYTDKEKEKLAILLKGTTRNVKAYYSALKALMKVGVYPPYSIQAELIKQASTFKLENEQEEQELNSLITENFKGSDLQQSSWAWKTITSARNDTPLRKLLTLLAITLKDNGINNAEELILKTNNFSRKVYTIGTDKFSRIAMREEIDNAANIRNMHIKYIPLYTPYEAYLTAIVHSLYAPSSFTLQHIHYYCTSADSAVPYELRFNNVAALQSMTHSTVSNAVMNEEFKKFVFANIPTFETIITQLLIEVPTLVKKWQNSIIETVYPDGCDALQAYYEYQNVDIDTLDRLLSIDADVSNIATMLKQVKDAGTRSSYDQVPYDIACRGLANIKKFGNHKLSEKQLQVIEKKAKSLNKTAEMSKDINAEECVEIANTIKNNHKSRMNSVISNIVESTLRYGICSQKQLDAMKLALVGYQQEVQQTAQRREQSKTGIMFNLPGTPAKPTVQKPVVQEEEQVEVPRVTTEEAADIREKQAQAAYKDAFGVIDDDDDDDTSSPWG